MVKDRLSNTKSALSKPLFDDRATAEARPVEPLPKNRLYSWLTKGSSPGELITRRTVALIVIAGLATGTLGGIALINQTEKSTFEAGPSLNESAIGMPARENFEPLDLGAQGLLKVQPPVVRRVNRPRAFRVDGRSAYRVAVIH